MSTWPTVRLGECCEIIGGATPRTSEPTYWGGDICWATPKDLSEMQGAYIADTPRKLTRAGLDSCGATVLPTESVLFSSRAPIGHVAVNTVPMATNQGFKSFIPKPGQLDPKFLYHWLRMNRPYLEAMGNGATFKELSKAAVSRVEISLPSLHEQQRIADVLDRAEELRVARGATLAQLDTLTQAIFLDMFGNSAAGVGDRDLRRLETLTDTITKGTTPTTLGLEYVDNGVPFLRVQNLRNGSVDLANDPLFISAAAHSVLARSQIRPRDVLVSIAGTIGRVAIVPQDAPTMNCNQAVAIVRPRGELTAEYLAAWLAGRDAQQRIRSVEVTGTITNLSLTQIRHLELPVPSIEAQHDFARRTGALGQLRQSQESSAAEVEALFASLQNRAFEGPGL